MVSGLWLPKSITSYLRHREVADGFFNMQMLIEHALSCDLELCGGTLDLEKAFNRYARTPTWHQMKLAGVNRDFLGLWQRQTSQLRRRFEVRGYVGKAIERSCGFPEGCPLSVVACLFNCLLPEL